MQDGYCRRRSETALLSRIPEPVPATMRIEAARRVFPRCWFNDSTTEAGRDALGYYHERQDEKRSIGLGPEHDWSSHAADGAAG